MALNLTKSFTFVPSTTISSSEVNTDFDTLYNAFTGLEAGTASMSKLPLDNDPTSNLYAATKQYVDAYANWKRPELLWISVSLVDVRSNTGTANQTKIVFPDGNYRSVTEDTASTNKYRRFDITATANFTSGTEDSGLRNGLSESANSWYAIYAVKSLINTANFVLVGDTTFPTQASFSTLNSAYGSNSWVYLGCVRNGDSGTSTTDILSFVQAGNCTIFTNTATAPNANVAAGVLLATTAGAATLTYTYASGVGDKNIPTNCTLAIYQGAAGSLTANVVLSFLDAGNARNYLRLHGNGANAQAGRWVAAASEGVQINNGTAASIPYDIYLSGFYDSALGVGSNPLLF